MRQMRENRESEDNLAATNERHTKERSSTHGTFRVVQIADV